MHWCQKGRLPGLHVRDGVAAAVTGRVVDTSFTAAALRNGAQGTARPHKREAIPSRLGGTCWLEVVQQGNRDLRQALQKVLPETRHASGHCSVAIRPLLSGGGGGQRGFLVRSLVDGAGSYSAAHRAGLLPTELTGMWGWILLRSPPQGRGSPPAPAPTKQRPGRNVAMSGGGGGLCFQKIVMSKVPAHV